MNTAQEIIKPKESGIFRTVFLYVGQGDATLLVVPNGDEYLYMLVDCHLGEELGGVNLPDMLSDLLDETENLIYVNTHPHNDHLSGIEKINESVNISEIWHSGHKPGKGHDEAFEELSNIIDNLDDSSVKILEGSQNEFDLGDVKYNILSPAEYVSDEIDDETPEERSARIHEQCAVLRFSYGSNPKSILITGDADLDAWKNHITEYHSERLPSDILSAPHHGSKSFFIKNDDDDPYLEHIDNISPDYIVISAPTSEESQHDHPHEYAVEKYLEYVDRGNLIHLGEKRESFIVDVDSSGNVSSYSDEGQLVSAYNFADDSSSKSGMDQSMFKFGDTSHQIEPAWNLSPNVQQIEIDAVLYNKKRKGKNIFVRTIKNNSDILLDNYEIVYRARVPRSIKYDFVKWQVVNTGNHVELLGEDAKRGKKFEDAKTQNGKPSKNPLVTWERTAYTGKHWIECFVVRNNVVVAQGKFVVNIINKLHPLT